MPGTNQYLPFAIGIGANTLSYATYSVDALVSSGHVPGVARAEIMNTTLRQLSVAMAGIAKFTVDNHPAGADMLDDGSVVNFATKFKAALDSAVAAGAGTTQSLAASGWCRFQNGLILQWQSCAAGYGNYSFPISFTSSVFVVCATNSSYQGDAVDNSFADSVSLSQFYFGTKSSYGELTGYPSYVISIGV